tara:strand:- start:373 stop:660 length:288 start_codon:yes stop_codon:yes gene_type:complete
MFLFFLTMTMETGCLENGADVCFKREYFSRFCGWFYVGAIGKKRRKYKHDLPRRYYVMDLHPKRYVGMLLNRSNESTKFDRTTDFDQSNAFDLSR